MDTLPNLLPIQCVMLCALDQGPIDRGGEKCSISRLLSCIGLRSVGPRPNRKRLRKGRRRQYLMPGLLRSDPYVELYETHGCFSGKQEGLCVVQDFVWDKSAGDSSSLLGKGLGWLAKGHRK